MPVKSVIVDAEAVSVIAEAEEVTVVIDHEGPPGPTGPGANAADIVLDPTGYLVLTATDVQGAFDETDAALTALAAADTISDSTALGTLTQAPSPTFLLGDNGAGTFAGKFAPGATGWSLLGAADAAAGRSVLGLGTLATLSPTGTPDGTKFLRGDGTWATVAAGVTSFNGRTGAVVPASGDYTAAMVTDAADKTAANTFAVGGQVIQGDLTVYGGTYAGATATEPGVTFKYTDNIGTGRIGVRGSSWNTLAFWGPGQTSSATPLIQMNSSGGVILGVQISHVASSIRFQSRNDLGTTPGVLIDSFAAGMPALRILAPASNTGESLQLWGTSSTATSRAQSAIISTWSDTTDASRKGRLALGVYYTTTLQTAVQIDAASGGDPTTTITGLTKLVPQSNSLTTNDISLTFQQYRHSGNGVGCLITDPTASFTGYLFKYASSCIGFGTGNCSPGLLDTKLEFRGSQLFIDALTAGNLRFAENDSTNYNALYLFHDSSTADTDTFYLHTTKSANSSFRPHLQLGGRSFAVRIGLDGSIPLGGSNPVAFTLADATGYAAFTPLTSTSTSGSRTALSVAPVYNQATGTAANTDLLVNRTETAVGSGTQLLLDLQVGGSSRFSVANTGALTVTHNGTKRIETNATGIGLFGATPVAQSTGWSVTNPATRKTFDTTTVTLPQLAEVVGTLVDYLKTLGPLAA